METVSLFMSFGYDRMEAEEIAASCASSFDIDDMFEELEF